MASTFVNGPCQIFVGIDPIFAATAGSVVIFQDRVMAPDPQAVNYDNLVAEGPTVDLGGELPTSPDFSGGSPLDNNPQRPVPASLFEILTQGLIKTGFLPVYLGTAERSPSIEIVRGWLPWFDDEMGSSLPADELYEGEEAWVTADVNRWNEGVYAFLSAVINRGALGGARGVNYPSDVGTSMVYEAFSYPLILQFPYAGKPQYRFQRMPAGYRFFNATLAGPDRLEPLGTQPSKRRLIWRCRELLDLDSGAMGLYDNFIQVGGIN